MEQVIAIFDIGKTNKKLLLFDRSYQVLLEEEVQIRQGIDDDGYSCEDVISLSNWIKKSLLDIVKSGRWEVNGLNFSAYGASFVYLDDSGKQIGNLLNYLKHYPVSVLARFYQEHGPRDEISASSASPPLGMLNSGLQLYWVKKEKPDLFKKIKWALHLPQYCSYLFTASPMAEMTSIGCHTYLWDFANSDYQSWAGKEGLLNLFPEIIETTAIQTISVEGTTFPCGIGIHDSSSALVPYLLSGSTPFALISTGTWSITLNPFNQSPLDIPSLKKDCLNYLSIQGNPVKSSRLFLGNEYDFQQKRLADFFQKGPEYHRQVHFDPQLVLGLTKSQIPAKKFFPQTMAGTGPFPDIFEKSADLEQFSSYEEAYHQLMLDLVSMQIASSQLVMDTVGKVFVSGGFVGNQVFMKLLATGLVDKEVVSTTLSRASALGAAMVIHGAWNDQPLEKGFLDQRIHPPVKELDLSTYRLFPD